jgi:hypothetical protein
MSATQILSSILSEIRPSNIPANHKKAMNDFRQEVAQFIQQRFPLHHERVGEPKTMGSKEKGTDIAQYYDLDLIVPFRFGYQQGPKGMKAVLHRAMQEFKGSMTTKVRDQRVSVGLRRRYQGTDLAIDIVPGMEKSPGAYNDNSAVEDAKYLVLYDRESNVERTTNIHRQVRLVKEKMLHYRDVVRLLKAWREKQNHKIGSFALESIVYQAATAKGAPKTGSIDKLLLHTLDHAISFLNANGSLQDMGANYQWPDFMKPSSKTQLAGLWKRLRDTVQADDPRKIRTLFI